MSSCANKYHSSGREYTCAELTSRTLTSRYIVSGYTNPKRSFEWYGESRTRPYNLGIKKANKAAASRGLKFNKQAYIRLHQG